MAASLGGKNSNETANEFDIDDTPGHFCLVLQHASAYVMIQTHYLHAGDETGS
jgi:hypothetical protein